METLTPILQQGLQTSVTVKNGDVFSGIFFGADVETNEPSYLLKMVQQVRSGNKSEVNGNQETLGEYIGLGDDHSMSFDIKEVADLAVDNVTLDHREKAQNGKFPLPVNHVNLLNRTYRIKCRVPNRYGYLGQYRCTGAEPPALGKFGRE